MQIAVNQPPVKPNLSAAQFNALQKRLDAIRADIESRIGEEDSTYLEALVKVKDRLERVGRLFIPFQSGTGQLVGRRGQPEPGAYSGKYGNRP